ncbi:MAG: hypothetical protein K2W96_00155 [Gemmataceae bacterium]|nr:hypothetical protein [Gemmataceae bacterium]
MTVAYEEIVDFIASGPTPERVAEFQPSEQARERVAELIGRKKSSALTSEEESELAHWLQLEHVMRLAKAKARQRLGP